MDYVPTVFAYNSKSLAVSRSQVSLLTCGTERSERLKKRKLSYLQERSTRRKVQLSSDQSPCEGPQCHESAGTSYEETGESNEEPRSTSGELGRSSEEESAGMSSEEPSLNEESGSCYEEPGESSGEPTRECHEELGQLNGVSCEQPQQSEPESIRLFWVIPNKRTTYCDPLEGNDKRTAYCTGIPSWELFLTIFSLLVTHPPLQKYQRSHLTLKDQFLLVLMRLRLNLMVEDLGYRFNISKSTVCRIFRTWIDVMYVKLDFLIVWPSKEIILHNMPQIFKDLYPNCRCIIDCTEIFMERPFGLKPHAQTYSNYKHHNTVKILIAITPCGTISFISPCWGGRVSDKYLTQNCGFLNLIEYGDTVLADRGFNISDDLAIHGATLAIPSFTKNKSQLRQQEVERSQRLSKVRIHVERVIGQLKTKYTILQSTLPVSVVKHNDDQDTANIDKIVRVCAALTNLNKSNVT